MAAWYPILVFGIEGITMFLRSTLVKSGDRKLRYWKLVENYHTQRGTRQRVVAHLGSLENFTSEDWRRPPAAQTQSRQAARSAAIAYRFW